MSNFFTGWIGYGTAVNGYTITEPTDAGYMRQPISFSEMSPYGPSSNGAGASFGPAVGSWGLLNYVGLFDAVAGGNCMAFWPLRAGLTVEPGHSFAVGDFRIEFFNIDRICQEGGVTYHQGDAIGKVNRESVVTAGALFHAVP